LASSAPDAPPGSGGARRSTVVDVEEGHVPVMSEEVMAALSPFPGSFQIDATVGGGGHALRILEASSPDGRLLGLDADRAAIARTGERLAGFGARVALRQANFEEIGPVAREAGFDRVDGVLFDLGLSSHQLADETRAFSFRAEGPLDMRFDTSRGVPASELVARLDERELSDLFRRWGEEPHARRIARAIVEARARAPIETGAGLADVVERAAPAPRPGRRRIHPATRVFQALRIAVNRELEVLPVALAAAVELLKPDGRLAVISYHSLEDRIVKRFVAAERRGCVCPPEVPVCVCGRAPRLAIVPPAPQIPTDAEVERNPRSRSARMRVARRLAA
jgi:16S rRNA (cytosine1402-N4)-methyltransferase